MLPDDPSHHVSRMDADAGLKGFAERQKTPVFWRLALETEE
jgi:hypothetical protein